MPPVVRQEFIKTDRTFVPYGIGSRFTRRLQSTAMLREMAYGGRLLNVDLFADRFLQVHVLK